MPASEGRCAMAEYRRRIPGLHNERVLHAMGIDDAYHVERVLARGSNGCTELVTIEGAGPFACSSGVFISGCPLCSPSAIDPPFSLGRVY